MLQYLLTVLHNLHSQQQNLFYLRGTTTNLTLREKKPSQQNIHKKKRNKLLQNKFSTFMYILYVNRGAVKTMYSIKHVYENDRLLKKTKHFSAKVLQYKNTVL